MAEGSRVIPICFSSLLRSITSELSFPEPVFECINSKQLCESIMVLTNVENLVYIYHGGCGGDLEKSYEQAAEEAIMGLVKNYKVRVVDFNWGQLCELEEQIRIFEIQRKWVTHFERKMKNVLPNHREWIGVDTRLFRISLDFVETLNIVVKKLDIKVSPLDCMQLAPHDFVCSIGLYSESYMYGVKWVVGTTCRTYDGAKQEAARKAVDLLRAMHHFEVKDVSFAALPKLRFEVHLLAESCIVARNRALVYEKPMEPESFVQEKEILCIEDINYMLSGSEKVEMLAAAVVNSLASKDFWQFIKENCSIGCYACGKKLKEEGVSFSVLRHCRDMGWSRGAENEWERLSVHRGVFYFVDHKLALLYPDTHDPDNGKTLFNFFDIASVRGNEGQNKYKGFEARARYILPATGILVNLPSRCHHGEIASRFAEKDIMDYLLMKGYKPLSVKTMYDDGGFCKCALVDFGTCFHSLTNAKVFENGFLIKGFGKCEWDTTLVQRTRATAANVYGWMDMEDDLYNEQGFCRLAISEKLQKRMAKQKIRVVAYVEYLRESNAPRKSGASNSSGSCC